MSHERPNCLRETLGPQQSLQQLALRYVLSRPEITSAIIDFGAVEHVEDSSHPTLRSTTARSHDSVIDSGSRETFPSRSTHASVLVAEASNWSPRINL